MSAPLANIVVRSYNGPYMTANLTHLAVTGNLRVSSNVEAASLTVTDRLSAATLDVTSTIEAPSMTLAANMVANSTYSNITTYGAQLFALDFNTGIKISNSTKRSMYGTVYLGTGSSANIGHGLDIEPNLYTVMTSFCDSGNTSQLVTVQVTNKGRDSFELNCVPYNSSNTASVDFVIKELVGVTEAGVEPPA